MRTVMTDDSAIRGKRPKPRRTTGIIGGAAAVLLIALAYLFIGNPVVAINNSKLKASITSISSERVELNDVAPFAWDAVYTFQPYADRSEIEETIGFKSNSIQETVSEGMVQLLFVKGERVVASVCGHAGALGYRIEFPDRIVAGEHAGFDVKTEDAIVVLTLAS